MYVMYMYKLAPHKFFGKNMYFLALRNEGGHGGTHR